MQINIYVWTEGFDPKQSGVHGEYFSEARSSLSVRGWRMEGCPLEVFSKLSALSGVTTLGSSLPFLQSLAA